MDMGDAFTKLEEQVLNLKEENERLKWYHRICIGDLIQTEKERDRLFGKTELLQKKLDLAIETLEDVSGTPSDWDEVKWQQNYINNKLKSIKEMK